MTQIFNVFISEKEMGKTKKTTKVKKCCKARKVVFEDESVHICLRLKNTWRASEIRKFKAALNKASDEFLSPPPQIPKSDGEKKEQCFY